MRMMVAPRVSANSFQTETSPVCLGNPKQKSLWILLAAIVASILETVWLTTLAATGIKER